MPTASHDEVLSTMGAVRVGGWVRQPLVPGALSEADPWHCRVELRESVAVAVASPGGGLVIRPQTNEDVALDSRP